MTATGTAWEDLSTTFSGISFGENKDCIIVQAHLNSLLELLTHLRKHDKFQMDYLKYLTVVDWTTHFELVYHLFSYITHLECMVSVQCPREEPKVPSCHHIWPAANWHEREMFDLFGVFFINHPNLQRLLLPPDWIGHPLRKDYVQEDRYQGVSTTRNYSTKLPNAPRS